MDERHKVTSGETRTCPAANNQHKFACFDVTSRVDIDCARSSLCQENLVSKKPYHNIATKGCKF